MLKKPRWNSARCKSITFHIFFSFASSISYEELRRRKKLSLFFFFYLTGDGWQGGEGGGWGGGELGATQQAPKPQSSFKKNPNKIKHTHTENEHQLMN